MGTISAISDSFVDAFAALDPVEAVRDMGVGLDADTMTDYSPDGQAAMADLYRARGRRWRRRRPRTSPSGSAPATSTTSAPPASP